MKFTIDTSEIGKVVFDGCQQNVDRETGEVRIDAETGLPRWSVGVLVKQPDARRAEPLNVSIPSKTDPCTGLAEFAPVKLKDLAIFTYNINGEKVNAFRATSITKA